MTIVRIAHAKPRPGKLENGGFDTRGHLVVLADDAGHRAVPVWLSGEQGETDLAELVGFAAQSAEELTTEVPAGPWPGHGGRRGRPGAAGRRGHGPGGRAGARRRPARPAPRHVPPLAQVPPGRGLRLAVGVLPGQRPRFAPRNLDFADGLDRWDLECRLPPRGRPVRPQDYSAAADGQSAVLSSAVPRPAGSASLVQSIFADDYRGATVTFGGEIRTEPGTEQAGLRLEILRHWWRTGQPREDHGITVAGGRPTGPGMRSPR